MLPSIPRQYIDYLAAHGVFEGFTLEGARPGYVALWPVKEIAGNNSDVEVETYAPGFLAFAGNGCGELLAFDPTGAVFMLPMIGMAPECAIRIADSFLDLAMRFEI
ncbi:hypothetical protein SB751_20295 [Cupriavidus sp. SIMBA_020]|uniref:SMI1/KNR4 family protein n=1 Tax=Cupriavidus sp. SIMBA_020 TaxID=3085766 RepID=UPI00397CE482